MGRGKRASTFQAIFGYLDLTLRIVQGLFFVPMYLKYIGAERYGFWLASSGVLVWLNILDFGLTKVLIQRVSSSHNRGDQQLALGYFTGAMVLYAFMAAAVVSIGIVASRFLPGILGAVGEVKTAVSVAFVIAAVGIAIRLVNDCMRGFLTALLKPVVPMTAIIGGRIIGVIVIFILVRGGFGIVGLSLGHLASASFILIVHCAYFPFVHSEFRLARLRIPPGVIGEYLRLAPATVGSRIGKSLSKSIEPTIITLLIGPSAATMFSVTRRAGQLLSSGLHVLVGASYPAYVRVVATDSTREIAKAGGKIIALVAHTAIVAYAAYIALNRSFVSLWVGSEQYAGNVFSILTGLALLMQVVQDLLSYMVIAERRIITVSLAEAAESLVRIGLMVAFAAIWGLSGPPLAMSITTTLCAIFFVITLVQTRPDIVPKLSLVPIFFSLFCSTSLVAVLMILVSPPESWIALLVLGGVCTLILSSIALVNRQFRLVLAEILFGRKNSEKQHDGIELKRRKE